MNVCRVADCDRTDRIIRELCAMHYQRFRVHGEAFDASPSQRATSSGTQEENFWAKVALTANSDKCWEWRAALTSKGYGNFFYDGRNWLAHRLSWLLSKRTAPQLFLLHSCDNPRCVNPKHLREGTKAENSQEMAKKGRQWKQALRLQRLEEEII